MNISTYIIDFHYFSYSVSLGLSIRWIFISFQIHFYLYCQLMLYLESLHSNFEKFIFYFDNFDQFHCFVRNFESFSVHFILLLLNSCLKDKYFDHLITFMEINFVKNVFLQYFYRKFQQKVTFHHLFIYFCSFDFRWVCFGLK